MKYFLTLLGLLVLITIVIVASSGDSTPPVINEPHIAVSIYPLYDIAQNIAGDKVEVTLLLPPGANPHTFEPTPSLITELQGVDAIYIAGYDIDEWAKGLVMAPALPLSTHVDLISRDSEYDPHYWLSIPNAKGIARTVSEELSYRYPQYAATFAANLATYTAELDTADEQIRVTLADLTNKNIVTKHDAWYYFAKEYGLTVLGVFEPSEGREPTPRELAALSTAIQNANLSTIFVDAGESEESLDAFIAENNLTAVTVDPEGTAAPTSYIELMLKNAQAFSQNR